jgi:hypothetical protein
LLIHREIVIQFKKESVNNFEFQRVLNTLLISNPEFDFYPSFLIPQKRMQAYIKASKCFYKMDTLIPYIKEIEFHGMFLLLHEFEKIEVSDPQFTNTFPSYTTFKISWRNYEIRTRFSELLALHEKMLKFDRELPTFPDKKPFNRFQTEVIKERVQSLNSYFSLLTDFEILSSQDFIAFWRKEMVTNVPIQDCLYSLVSPMDNLVGCRLVITATQLYLIRLDVVHFVFYIGSSEFKKMNPTERKHVDSVFDTCLMIRNDESIIYLFPSDMTSFTWKFCNENDTWFNGIQKTQETKEEDEVLFTEEKYV